MHQIKIIDGPGSMPCLEIINSSAKALISLYGAHVLSFIPVGEEEVLMLSENSNFTYGKAIRGGIPVCWPWFSAHPVNPALPSHGFARIHGWALENIQKTSCEDGSENTIAVFNLLRSAYSANFEIPEVNVRLIAEVGKKLKVSLETENLSGEEFSYSCALHTYFNVSDISNVRVTGLEGDPCFDSLKQSMTVENGAIAFTEEYDRIFFSTNTCVIHDSGMARKIVIAKENSGSTVVWNPWIDKSIRMADFGDKEYLKMLCIETACVKSDARTLNPGAKSTHSAIISVEH